MWDVVTDSIYLIDSLKLSRKGYFSSLSTICISFSMGLVVSTFEGHTDDVILPSNGQANVYQEYIFSHSSKVRERAKAVVFKLKSELPRQQFSIAIQAAVSGKILARGDLKALKKDVLAKCYGGDH